MMPKASLTPVDVAALVERYLEPHQPVGYRILIDRRGVQEDKDGWWEVPIRPSKDDVPSRDWIGRSAEAAGEIDEAEGVHIIYT